MGFGQMQDRSRHRWSATPRSVDFAAGSRRGLCGGSCHSRCLRWRAALPPTVEEQHRGSNRYPRLRCWPSKPPTFLGHRIRQRRSVQCWRPSSLRCWLRQFRSMKVFSLASRNSRPFGSLAEAAMASACFAFPSWWAFGRSWVGFHGATRFRRTFIAC